MRNPINRLATVLPKREPAEVGNGRGKATWNDRAKSWEHSLESLLAEHPKIALAAAAGLGLMLGWIVKRK